MDLANRARKLEFNITVTTLDIKMDRCNNNLIMVQRRDCVDERVYQKIIMPFLEPIVYPSEWNKNNIEETIYIRNILRSCGQENRK